MSSELGSLSQSSAILPESLQEAASYSSSPYHLHLSIEVDHYNRIRSDMTVICIYKYLFDKDPVSKHVTQRTLCAIKSSLRRKKSQIFTNIFQLF